MPSIFLSLITSGSIKWLSILILVSGLIGGLYMKHREVVNSEKRIALQEYNIKQLEQNVKDRDLFIQQMEEISNHKSQIINDLYRERDSLEEQSKKIEIIIEKHKATGGDKQSSKILKDTFRELEKMK